MKKVLLLFISIILLTGCMSESDKDLIVRALKENNIINNYYNKIDVIEYKRYVDNRCEKVEYYIYEDKEYNLIAIEYKEDNSFLLYNNLRRNENIDKWDKEPNNCENAIYKLSDGSLLKSSPYTLYEYKEYNAIKKSNKYEIEER